MNVTIELIDDATGDVFAESEAPIESLPQYFARMDTRLTVGDAEYSVVHSDPANREDIRAAGKVRLRLRKVVAVDPKTILYSLPTIEDVIPERVGSADVDKAMSVTPDEYRQVELVSAAQRAAVDAELDDVRRVIAAHHKGAGFDEIHVRKRVTEPLAGVAVTLAELEEALGAKARGLALRGQSGVIKGGFAIPQADALVYGVARDGVVTALCTHGIYGDVAGLLHPLAVARGLLLVDWCNARCLRAHEEGFVE